MAEKQSTFSSFSDLARHVKTNVRRAELAEALKLGMALDGDGAVGLLDHHDLTTEQPTDRVKYGLCYAQGAKTAIFARQWPQAQARLKKAITLGFQPWHVHRRMELVNRAMKEAPALKREDGDWIDLCMSSCRSCFDEVTPLICARCTGVLKPPVKPVYQDHVDDLFALGVYRWVGDPDSFNPLSRMIRWLKGNEGKQSCRYLAYLLVEALRADTAFLRSADFIVPVPSDPERAQSRGFDNIMELATHVEAFALLPVADGVVRKIHATEDLRHVPWNMRAATLEGSLEVPESKHHQVSGATVLLLDDVVTSGATLDLCASLLLDAGAAKVIAAVLARSESTQASERYA